MPLDNVLWLGGGCGAGKTTTARRLAYRFDLRFYPVDAYTFAHEARATPAGQPFMTHLAGLDFTARHVTPTVPERVEQFVGHASERFALVLEDLRPWADGPLVLAEGPGLLPELVAPHLAGPGHALWLLPAADFTARNLGVRNEPVPTEDETERGRAHRLRLLRDAELTARMRRDTARLGLNVFEVDGSLSLDETEEHVAAYFGLILRRGSTMRSGAERAEARRAENAVVNRQIAAFHAYLGDAAPADPPPFPYACECTTLGCTAQVPLTPAAYHSAGGALAPPSRPLLPTI